ncbi:MAG: hypothetical protein D4R43_00725, partial [Sphingobacteriales bacterium]
MKNVITVYFLVLVLNAQAQENYFNITYDNDKYNSTQGILQLPDSGYLAAGFSGKVSPFYLNTNLIRFDKNGNFISIKKYGNNFGVEGINQINYNSSDSIICYGTYRTHPDSFTQVFLMSAKINGDSLWRKFYGIDSLNENSANFIFNDDTSYLASYTFTNSITYTANQKMVLIKTDASGNQQFYKTYKPNTQGHYKAECLIRIGNGDIILGGYRYIYANGDGLDFCLIKTDSAGNFKWQKYFPHQGWDDIQVMALTDSNTILMFGYKCPTGYTGGNAQQLWMGIADTAGNMLSEKVFLSSEILFDVQCNRLIKNNEGNFVLTGTYKILNAGNEYYPFILKVTAEGDSLWMRTYHKNINAPSDFFYDIKQTYDNGYIIAGNTYNAVTYQDAWLLKVDCLGFDSPDSSICFITETIADTICEGSAYNFYGNNLTTSGSYIDTVVVYCYCDTIVTLQLTVLPMSNSLITQSICEGGIYNFNGMNLSIAGNYADTLTNILGCDSIIQLQLSVLPISNFSFADSICEGDVFDFNGMNLSVAGNYSDTLTNILGCDSVVILDLTILNSSTASFTQIICDGEVFDFNGTNLNATGVYSDTINATNGCDSTITLSLIIEIINAAIQQSNDTLIATGNGTIQWFDCNAH